MPIAEANFLTEPPTSAALRLLNNIGCAFGPATCQIFLSWCKDVTRHAAKPYPEVETPLMCCEVVYASLLHSPFADPTLSAQARVFDFLRWHCVLVTLLSEDVSQQKPCSCLHSACVFAAPFSVARTALRFSRRSAAPPCVAGTARATFTGVACLGRRRRFVWQASGFHEFTVLFGCTWKQPLSFVWAGMGGTDSTVQGQVVHFGRRDAAAILCGQAQKHERRFLCGKRGIW